MSLRKVKEDIYSVGILNPNLRIFDVVMETKYGTTYNSYIVKGTEKTALIETCHLTYWEQYLKNIKEVCSPEEIDYIILNHNEPDHSGVLAQLIKLCPNATIIESKAGSTFLKNIANRTDLPIQVVNDGDTIDLGQKELKFISAPFLHWPDSMFTWCESEKTLFPCDFLGAHYCEAYDFDYNTAYPKKYEDGFKGYYDAIFAPFKPYVLAGLEKIKDLDVENVCPCHGPVLTKGNRLEYAIEKYAEWSKPAQKDVKSIPIFYCSAYGHTGSIANAIKEGILEAIPNADTQSYDINEYDMGVLQQKLNSSDAFAIGSPTINADAVAPVWNLLSHVDAINNKKRPVLAFGSFGWSGEAVPNIIARLNGLKTSVFGEGFKVTFVPSEDDLKRAKELGTEFAKSLI